MYRSTSLQKGRCIGQPHSKILKAYNLETCKQSKAPGKSRSLEQTDNEDLKNLKQLLRYIKGTMHYKVILAPKALHNEKKEIQVNIDSFADSDWAGCNTTRKSKSGTITSCWGTPLLHISRTQCTIALSSTEAELYAIEAQHIKQVIEKMATPNISPHVTMSINTDSSAGKAVASRLGLNKKTKHIQLRYMYMQDIIQRGEVTITRIPATDKPCKRSYQTSTGRRSYQTSTVNNNHIIS
eukprot:6484085-Amphidinium_carterae.6